MDIFAVERNYGGCRAENVWERGGDGHWMGSHRVIRTGTEVVRVERVTRRHILERLRRWKGALESLW